MSSITWRTETRTLDSLNLRDDNPRYLTDEQEKRLRGSLHKFGYSQLIEVNPDGTVLDGHQRTPLMIAMEEFGEGYEVEVRVPSRALTQKEWQEYTALKHQGAAGSFDFEMLKDWGVDNLLEWGFEENQLVGIIPFDPNSIEFPEYDESVANEVEYIECPECGHRWPK